MLEQKILIIDDEVKLRSLLSRILEREGYTITQAGDFKTAFKLLEKDFFPIILCDVKLPDGNGVENIPKLLAKTPASQIILLTAYGNIADGVQAIKNGAFDYITKGDDNDRIIPLVESAFKKTQMQHQLKSSVKNNTNKYSIDDIVGNAPTILAAKKLAEKVAPSDVTVLLMGETGTGKEVFAQSIHNESGRKSQNFVALNCSAFSHEIMESELFGHVSGSFTGATKDKKGLVEEANGGTLFLDEIGELPLDLQAKLLRILETKTYMKVGDTKPLVSDFRLIAATNKNLKTESENGQFRQDLYFRLNIFEIVLPPLRERGKDALLLAEQLVKDLSIKNNMDGVSMSSDYKNALLQWHWPGNIRELRNVLERSLILSNNDSLSIETLPLEMIATNSSKGKQLSAFSLSSVEKLHIQKVLNYTKGNKAEAARLLEIGTATLYRKLDEYQLQG